MSCLQMSRNVSASVKGSSANIDMTKLSLGGILGKGSLGYVKLVGLGLLGHVA